jgi:cytochrome c oxidase accessory protein FixG
MFDPTTANVSYDRQRGEPRSSSAGDCIDCGICVQVCPTGIDIRDGLQLACTNCGLCIDACDQVMAKIEAPSGLIRFASEQELAGRGAPQAWKSRPRVVLYAALLLIFAGFFVLTVSTRSLVLVDVLRDRGALSRETADGRIENAYTLKLMNLDHVAHEYRLSVRGFPGLEIIGQKDFVADPGSIQSLLITVSAPAQGTLSGIQPIYFAIHAKDDPANRIEEKSTFALK